MKEIKTLTVKAIDLKTGFGNPRKIGKKKRDELRESLEKFGDKYKAVINENGRIVANSALALKYTMNARRELNF